MSGCLGARKSASPSPLMSMPVGGNMRSSTRRPKEEIGVVKDITTVEIFGKIATIPTRIKQMVNTCGTSETAYAVCLAETSAHIVTQWSQRRRARAAVSSSHKCVSRHDLPETASNAALMTAQSRWNPSLAHLHPRVGRCEIPVSHGRNGHNTEVEGVNHCPSLSLIHI